MVIRRSLVVFALAGVVVAAGLAPSADAQTKGRASVTNGQAVMDPGGGVPVKVHCSVSKGKRCKGTLLLVSETSLGNSVKSYPQAYVVPGGKTRTIRIQASGAQVTRLVETGGLDGVVTVKERKPRHLSPHSTPITVRTPA